MHSRTFLITGATKGIGRAAPSAWPPPGTAWWALPATATTRALW